MAHTQVVWPVSVPMTKSAPEQVVHVSPTIVEVELRNVLAAQGSQASEVAVPAAMRTEPAAHVELQAVQGPLDGATE